MAKPFKELREAMSSERRAKSEALARKMKDNSAAKKCPLCGQGHLERKTALETVTYEGESKDIEQPGYYCDNCGEGFLTGDDTRMTRKAIQGLHERKGHKG